MPVWSIRAESLGFIAGQRPIKDRMVNTPVIVYSERGPVEVGQENKEVRTGGEVIKKTVWLEQEFSDLGLKWRELAGCGLKQKIHDAALKPLDEKALSDKGLLLEPSDLPEFLALRQAEKYFTGNMLFPYGDYPLTTHAIAQLKQRRRLVYYPVWRIWGFSRLGRISCLVDAVDGSKLSWRQHQQAKHPGPTKHLLYIMSGILALSLIYAGGTSGEAWLTALAPVALIGLIFGGIAFSNYIMSRWADRIARDIMRL